MPAILFQVPGYAHIAPQRPPPDGYPDSDGQQMYGGKLDLLRTRLVVESPPPEQVAESHFSVEINSELWPEIYVAIPDC